MTQIRSVIPGSRSFEHAAPWLLRLVRLQRSAHTLLAAVVWPLLDLGVRLWLAKIYFVSGVLKVTHWETALDLAANEYPVSWMDPVTAAYTGAAIEVLGPLFLATGLLTRYAALPMGLLALTIQFNYIALDSQLLWAAFFLWYTVHGAGPISFDHQLRRGLADSALPFAGSIVRYSSWVRLHIGPFVLSGVRLWLALTLLAAALTDAPIVWLPIASVAQIPAIVLLLAGTLLTLGTATRALAFVLLPAISLGGMMNAMPDTPMMLAAVLGFLVIHGGGPLALDHPLNGWLLRSWPDLDPANAFVREEWPKVVIVGAGFGGMSCAAALRHAPVSVTLIDRANHHLFQPMLYQVATAAISPSDIAAPVRPLFRDTVNTRVLLGNVSAVDTSDQTVVVDDKRIAYDYLVLATGATHSYFGKDEWGAFAPGLKRLEDATEIRRRLLLAFERAEATDDPEERRALLTFLIVGGGPTGVELAGAIAELARFGMEAEFRSFDPASSRVVLIQSGPRLLPAFDERLAAVALHSLEKLGVEVKLGARVEHIDAQGVKVSGERLEARTVMWAAGVTASPAARWLNVEADNAGRIKVNADLSVPGLPNVFAIGDTAASLSWHGQLAPGLAPAAKQGGAYVARFIETKIANRSAPPSFVYRHLGSLATIGRKAAIADFGFIRLWGTPAWWLWGIVHIAFLVGLRNRLATLVNWFWAYLTFGGGIRLITGAPDQALSVAPAKQPVVSQRSELHRLAVN